MFGSSRVRQTVILAAGSGSRLASTNGSVPKPLMTVGGIPLIAHALAHAEAAGCEEALVIIGHEGIRVRDAIEAMQPRLQLSFIQSRDHSAPNGVSLLAAEPLAAPAFYLQMVDHLFAEPALERLVATPLSDDESGRVLVDSTPSPAIDLDDATKVCLAGSRVTAIGKRLPIWDAIDAGCFVLTPAIFEALRRVPVAEGLSVSSGMRQLVAQGRLGAVDVCGTAWVDVDTPADRDQAEQLLERRQLAQDRC